MFFEFFIAFILLLHALQVPEFVCLPVIRFEYPLYFIPWTHVEEQNIKVLAVSEFLDL